MVSILWAIASFLGSRRSLMPPIPSDQSSWNQVSSSSGGNSAWVSSPMLRIRGRMVWASLRRKARDPDLSLVSMKPRWVVRS